jgi:hypothetical protein
MGEWATDLVTTPATQTPEAPRGEIAPPQLIANVARALLALAERRPHDGQLAELRKVAQHLVELADAHARGELPALADDGLPF